MKKIISNQLIEERADHTLTCYEKKYGTIAVPPIPIENVIMQALGLTVQWRDDIEEEDGVKILGGLSPAKRSIVLNEKHRGLFERTRGLERSTIGHEAGHWEFDVDKNSLGHPFLPGFAPAATFVHAYSRSVGELSVFRGDIHYGNNQRSKYDTQDQARVVNRFAAALSMPRHLVSSLIKKYNVLSWSGIEDIQRAFDVSRSAILVRLQQLNYIYVEDRQIHRSKAEALGQSSFGF
jgi:hypothetical protein